MSHPRSIAPLGLSDEGVRRARRHLLRRDPTLAALIRRAGPCRLGEGRRIDPFTGLVRTILSQQLSTTVAETIFSRVAALAGGADVITCQRILALPDDALRRAGMSRPKIAYLRDLASRVESGALDLPALARLPDEDVIAAITSVKGLGRWSADMYLMFRLVRPDVLPVGDLGIVRGFQKLYGLRKPPAERTMRRIAAAWQPYRSVGSWYLWRIHD